MPFVSSINNRTHDADTVPPGRQTDRQVSLLLGCGLQPARTRRRWAELLTPGLQGCLDTKHPAQHMKKQLTGASEYSKARAQLHNCVQHYNKWTSRAPLSFGPALDKD